MTRPSRTPAEAGRESTARALVLGYLNRAAALHGQGYADRAALDTAMRLGCGLPEGPFEMIGRLGADAVHRSLTELWVATGDEAYAPAPWFREPGRPAPETPSPTTGPGNAEAAPVRRLGILGSGTMARGIAEAAARNGVATVLVARSTDSAERARTGVGQSLERSVRRGRTTASAAAEAVALLDFTVARGALGDRDLVVEAVAEDEQVKREAFAMLGAVCAPGTVLATTTSSLSVTAGTASAGRPGEVLGLHFFNPAPVMKLVELIRTPTTTTASTATARAFCAALGKVVVDCGDRAGFIVNFLLFPYLARAVRLLESCADGPAERYGEAARIDEAVVAGSGFPMGPFALLDTIGLDVSVAILDRLHREFADSDFEPPALLRRMLDDGCLGRKNGRGFRVL
ncbi:3-hydroxyacyl-CoA dehydrogenase NAD-binding domain-containing protein [Streptomyces sp. NPDC050256]|uniref:3-hydroxyacyl-CoA dehydrogenase NAD-binding domain-containing protein n=1 Tax=Streptomyces sp. NPDC050256 TaxID=3365607 RepID=UPI0037B9050B